MQAEPNLPDQSIPSFHAESLNDGSTINDVLPLPSLPWANSIIKGWDISESGAQSVWTSFLNSGMDDYKEGRNFPNKPFVSRLSPYIHFGQISIRQLYHDTQESGDDKNRYHFYK